MKSATAVAFVLLTGTSGALPNLPAQQPQDGKTAGEVFKNVQVLKRVPADQWFGTMAFIAGSLGVTCDHCHSSSFEIDEGNSAKLKAREMMRMVDEINRNSFKGQALVTCNSCHRGSLKPQATPVPDAENWIKAGRQVATPPAASAILSRYRKSFVLSASDSPLAQSASLDIATYGGKGAANRASMEVTLAGEKAIRLSTRAGETTKSLLMNGEKAWKNEGNGWKMMSRGEESAAFDQARLLAADPVADAEVAGPALEDQVYGQRAFLVPVTSKGRKKWLFFDANTGALLKQRVFFPSFYGDGSVDIDYADYRNFGKITAPTTFQVINAGGSGLTIIHATSRRFNIKLKRSEFDIPGE